MYSSLELMWSKAMKQVPIAKFSKCIYELPPLDQSKWEKDVTTRHRLREWSWGLESLKINEVPTAVVVNGDREDKFYFAPSKD